MVFNYLDRSNRDAQGLLAESNFQTGYEDFSSVMAPISMEYCREGYETYSYF